MRAITSKKTRCTGHLALHTVGGLLCRLNAVTVFRAVAWRATLPIQKVTKQNGAFGGQAGERVKRGIVRRGHASTENPLTQAGAVTWQGR